MQSQAARRQPLAPHEEKFTTWHNPTDHEQKIDVFYGAGVGNEERPTRYIVPSKGDLEIPSRWDSAIHRVQCADDTCRRIGSGFCTRDHAGTVIGGIAPQLQKKGQRAQLLPALDPTAAEKLQKAAEVAAASIARRDAENTMLLAESRRRELEDEEKARDSAKADAKPAKK